MKSFKKVFAFVLVFVMMAAIGVTASATGTTYTITISNSATGHTYEAYQVFTGDLSEGVLSNVQWGSGVNSTALLAALQADTAFGTGAANIFASATNAAGVADALDGLTDDSAIAKEFAQVVGQNLSAMIAGTSTYNTTNYTITGLAAGYYFVKDQSASLNGDEDAYTSYVLEVVIDVTVTPKSAMPSVVKKVLEESYATDGGYGTGYNDVADYDIGDAVPFKLIGTLPTNYADYASYAYIFRDTESAGLTFNSGTVSVAVVNGDTSTTIAASNYTVATTGLADGRTFEVQFENLKAITGVTIDANSKIVVTYTSTLNSNAVIGLDGNPNQVYLTFSNNPNTGNSTDTGKTPVDRVIVFTYQLGVTKIDGDTANNETPTALANASFVLYKVVEGTNTYAIVANGKVTGWTTTEASATTLTSDANGLFSVAGLDDGVYFIKETAAPAGYNLLAAPVELTIAATTANGQSWTSGLASDALTALTITVGDNTTNGTLSTGAVTTTVANNSGATLPSTGGIGTTIFYIVGGLLMAAAVVLLVTKKKMSARQD